MERFNGVIHGDSTAVLAEQLYACASIDEYRALAPLPLHAEELIDNRVVSVGLDRLTIMADAIAAGLTVSMSDWLAIMELYWESESQVGNARRTMELEVRGENAIPDRTGQRIPIFATMEDFNFGARLLAASRRGGQPLDLSMVSQAARRVNEALEDQAINGTGASWNGNDAPGLLNAPNVNTNAYVDNEAWDASGHSGEDILTDVLGMADTLLTDNFPGPYTLYIPKDYQNKLNQDFKSATSGTIRQRLEELVFNGRNLVVKTADRLPDDRTVLIQWTDNVADVIDGQQPTAVSWQGVGPAPRSHFAIVACQILRVKNTYSGQSGICTGNLA